MKLVVQTTLAILVAVLAYYFASDRLHSNKTPVETPVEQNATFRSAFESHMRYLGQTYPTYFTGIDYNMDKFDRIQKACATLVGKRITRFETVENGDNGKYRDATYQPLRIHAEEDTLVEILHYQPSQIWITNGDVEPQRDLDFWLDYPDAEEEDDDEDEFVYLPTRWKENAAIVNDILPAIGLKVQGVYLGEEDMLNIPQLPRLRALFIDLGSSMWLEVANNGMNMNAFKLWQNRKPEAKKFWRIA